MAHPLLDVPLPDVCHPVRRTIRHTPSPSHSFDTLLPLKRSVRFSMHCTRARHISNDAPDVGEHPSTLQE